MAGLNFFIDTGGTFTDCLAMDSSGNVFREKILSSSAIRVIVSKANGVNQVVFELERPFPENFFQGYTLQLLGEDVSVQIVASQTSSGLTTLRLNNSIEIADKKPAEIQSPEEPPVFAMRLITGTLLQQQFSELSLRLSTTKGTNALLERKGAKSLLVVSKGFADILKIRNQQRPELFSLKVVKDLPCYTKVIEIAERLDAQGNPINPINENDVEKIAQKYSGQFESVGICFMHAYRNPKHEQIAKEVFLKSGFKRISCSSDLSSIAKYVVRANTTDINTYLAPVMNSYFEKISESIGEDNLKIMTSAGSLTRAGHFEPKDGLLSGPAGGVVGAISVATDTARVYGGNDDFCKIISFDMGGTSTDVARFDGNIELIYEHRVGQSLLNSPAVDIETVAAGGGSICGFDGLSLFVGPESAGANPGPACYGKGGPLTITDVNLLFGKIQPSNFGIDINVEQAEKRFREIVEGVTQAGQKVSRNELLQGFLDIANERMAQTIHKISIQKGFNPSEYTMVAFGGAGAQHAIAVAEKLNISKVIVPTDAGLLSAYGLQKAKMEAIADRQILRLLNDVKDDLSNVFAQAQNEAIDDLISQGINKDEISISSRILHLRFKGQDATVEVSFRDRNSILDEFKQKYKELFGHLPANRPIELESIKVTAAQQSKEKGQDNLQSPEFQKANQKPIFSQSGWKYYDVGVLETGCELPEESIVLDPFNTIVIEKGWRGRLLSNGNWLLEQVVSSGQNEVKKTVGEFAELQLFMNRFRSVAEQMGEMLQRTSISVNVKERLDFSCALLDKDGNLIVNAPHIPVHLGAMGTCVKSVLRYKNIEKELQPGDVLITNHPGYGGSHLPDVTVITPVFDGNKRIGFVASRAHHAEIGGSRPGSMPPDAKTLADEGVVILPMFLAKSGIFLWDDLKEVFDKAAWPSRNYAENISDIEAAIAANHRGVTELQKLTRNFGIGKVTSYMDKILHYASQRLRITLENIKDGIYAAEEKLDDGSVLMVSCKVDGHNLSVDFTGTSPVQDGNLNANPSIVNSVLMYVLRLLINEPLPLNDGLLNGVEINLPECMLNPGFDENPNNCPAVVGGNTETSQRLADTLLKAFGMAACSYGTMNNVLFGNDDFGYYETVAGGNGAGNGFDGADAVHQHMTNTRAADPEVLELRYPVRLDEYRIRRESGGKGKWNGGDGIIRKLTFLEPVQLSVLTQHRNIPPFGLGGGEAGMTGSQWIVKDGQRIKLEWKDQADLNPGDTFELYTPGGGGFGNPGKQ